MLNLVYPLLTQHYQTGSKPNGRRRQQRMLEIMVNANLNSLSTFAAHRVDHLLCSSPCQFGQMIELRDESANTGRR
jgi:hypothetical protein